MHSSHGFLGPFPPSVQGLALVVQPRSEPFLVADECKQVRRMTMNEQVFPSLLGMGPLAKQRALVVAA